MSGQTGTVKLSRLVLAEICGLDVDEIKDDAKLGADLKVGSIVGNIEVSELWWKLEKAYEVSIPEGKRPSSEELLGRTASQFDAIVDTLVSDEKGPVDEETDAGQLQQKILDSSQEIPSVYE